MGSVGKSGERRESGESRESGERRESRGRGWRGECLRSLSGQL